MLSQKLGYVKVWMYGGVLGGVHASMVVDCSRSATCTLDHRKFIVSLSSPLIEIYSFDIGHLRD